MTEPLWILTGPTASGKSAWAMDLAHSRDLEVVSMDSMAVYRQMDIGTAKPSAEERAGVPHHLLDVVDPDQTFDTATWCELAQSAIEDIQGRGRRPLLVGGTALYLMAFCKGMVEGPAADLALRTELAEREANEPGSLHAELSIVDPQAAARIHRHDRKRLVRALEVYRLTGTPLSQGQQHFESEQWLRPSLIVAVRRPRAELRERVNQRTRSMLADGLLDEVRAIRDSCGFSRTAGAAIGYAECLDYLARRYKDEEELRNRIRRNTHRLIRRQENWLRRIEVQWLPATAGWRAAEAAFLGSDNSVP